MRLSPRLAALALLPAAVWAQTDAARAASPLPSAAAGKGPWRFEVVPGWARLTGDATLAPTHGGVVVDRAGDIYVSSDGPQGILVFAPDGTLRRTLPKLSGVHGLTLNVEGGREYLYVAHLREKQVAKVGLDGQEVWRIGVPKQSGFYDAPADPKKKAAEFRPTGVAVAPDGRVYVADGYGASVVHVFGADQKYQKTIGTKGTGDGQFSTCHGIALDTRYGEPRLLVCDRENRRLVHVDLEGRFLGVLTRDLRRPCSVSIRGDHVAVAELEGRVALVDKQGAVVATLGGNPYEEQWANFKVKPELWGDGVFTAPHGISFDAAGNLFVQDWNFQGRFTKLRHAPAK